ncbi:speedy protein 1-B-like [Discoglossus pictus]
MPCGYPTRRSYRPLAKSATPDDPKPGNDPEILTMSPSLFCTNPALTPDPKEIVLKQKQEENHVLIHSGFASDLEPVTEEVKARQKDKVYEKNQTVLLGRFELVLIMPNKDDIIQKFLASDSCLKMSDKYLIAMVFTYFKKAHLDITEYNRLNFFIALLLANEMEEDEPFYDQIYVWALGRKWYRRRWKLWKKKNELWRRMGFHALVSTAMCEQIMAEDPSHWAWRRERKEHHSWALKYNIRTKEEFFIRAPGDTPSVCTLCNVLPAKSSSQKMSAWKAQ